MSLNPATLVIGGRYNWKNQGDRLVYMGKERSWHQFALVAQPRKIWCEVLDADLHMLEETAQTPEVTTTAGEQGSPVAGDRGQDVPEIDDYSRHEALDRTSIFCNMLSNQLLDHHFIQSRPEFRMKVEAAVKQLFSVYQAIGAEHLSPPAPAQPSEGCHYCLHPMFAALKCPGCGRRPAGVPGTEGGKQ